MLEKIPGNVREDSGEYSKIFRGMLQRIPGNVHEDSGECSTKFRGMFERIPGNLNLDLFCEILLIFLLNPAIKLRKKQRNIFCATNYYIKLIFYA